MDDMIETVSVVQQLDYQGFGRASHPPPRAGARLLPFLQYYVDSGHFTFIAKFKYSLRKQLIYYAILGGCGLFFVVFHLKLSKILKWTQLSLSLR